ncbi:acetoacetate decarboxylase family protein [Actinospongicola halichondriae]|uniref:acetoacetate decarboxylase family protein n=1 Tax=Actinospongicola halichondriae TaxID=3236844 RepID=UPI003D502594
MGEAATGRTYEIQGTTIGFPIEVRLARMANAVYTVPAEVAATMIDDSAFEVDADVHGAASVVVGFVDYVDNDLGDYDEVMLAVMAKTTVGGEQGTFIWRLPVNQEFTREAGVRMLGLPKTVEDIVIERDETSVTCTLRSNGALVLRQRFPLLAEVEPVPMPSPTVCLSTIDGAPCLSESEPTGSLRMAFGGDGYSLELGDHPWAEELRTLGITDAEPTVVTMCDDWRSIFRTPVPITTQ